MRNIETFQTSLAIDSYFYVYLYKRTLDIKFQYTCAWVYEIVIDTFCLHQYLLSSQKAEIACIQVENKFSMNALLDIQ